MKKSIDQIIIPLCVPRNMESKAMAHGATKDPERKHFILTISPSELQKDSPLLSFLPHRYQPERKAPFLRPWLVPQPLWGWNLRSMLARNDWDIIRRAAYQATGYRCRICGGIGPRHPVEADEGWAYNDKQHIQILKGVVALCPSCHGVRHWGRSLAIGKGQEALDWLAHINRWSATEARICTEKAMEQWKERSQHDWSCDISWIERRFKVNILDDALERAQATQLKLVKIASGE